MTGNIDDVNAPRSMTNIVQEVTAYVMSHFQINSEGRVTPPTEFRFYDDALNAIWPELYKTSREAHLMVAVSVYVEIAERWGFEVAPEIREMRI